MKTIKSTRPSPWPDLKLKQEKEQEHIAATPSAKAAQALQAQHYPVATCRIHETFCSALRCTWTWLHKPLQGDVRPRVRKPRPSSSPTLLHLARFYPGPKRRYSVHTTQLCMDCSRIYCTEQVRYSVRSVYDVTGDVGQSAGKEMGLCCTHPRATATNDRVRAVSGPRRLADSTGPTQHMPSSSLSSGRYSR